MDFSPSQLLRSLSRLPVPSRYWVAYSGGLDSHALLHALHGARHDLGASVGAVHVHHGLHPDADHWTEHCAHVCAGLSLPLETLRVDARAGRGQSPEAAAREARYRALASVVAAGDILLTAHHQQDQAETLLLQLLRGSGPHGLAAMPFSAEFGRGLLARPLLEVTRGQLQDYARRYGLHWVEDSSNARLDYDRNFLRHRVVPLLTGRWPAAAATLSRAAQHCADAARLLDALAAVDRETAATDAPRQLSVTALRVLSPERRRNVLRYWVREQGLPLPSAGQLQQVAEELLQARPDATPVVHWPGAEVRRYRDGVYLMSPLAPPDLPAAVTWRPNESLGLPHGRLSTRPVQGAGLAERVCRGPMTVRFRQGGERYRPPGRQRSRSLKKRLQEYGVPPWQRARLPLVYIGDELAAVADLWVCAPFAAQPGEPGRVIVWEQA
ncbi:MAG: tRNA lysidine(34) synthetase TilS [Gammaproteobacteria bacterium]